MIFLHIIVLLVAFVKWVKKRGDKMSMIISTAFTYLSFPSVSGDKEEELKLVSVVYLPLFMFSVTGKTIKEEKEQEGLYSIYHSVPNFNG